MLEEVDLDRLEEQVAQLRPFRRLAAYRGAARELGWVALNMAMWPLGLVDNALRMRLPRLPVTLRTNTTQRTNGSRGGHVSAEAADIPILLLHGYFHNQSGFLVMKRGLKKKGFNSIHTFNYNPLGKGVHELSEEVAGRVDDILNECGSNKIRLVGHSLGGILSRYYVEELGGSGNVEKLITLGTPHHGTFAAYMARSETAKQMRPGSELLRKLNSKPKPSSVSYISYYSNLDALVVPAASALLEDEEECTVRNILVHDMGHLSLLISAELIDSIASSLADCELSGSTLRSQLRRSHRVRRRSPGV